MMPFYKKRLKNVNAFIFDVDGVLSKDYSPLNKEGDPVRTANVKDGFAIRFAINSGYPVAVISGGFIERVRFRYEKIGVKFYFDNVENKEEYLDRFIAETGVKKKNVLFMGDDLVDYAIMMKVGIPACPRDAVSEIKAISRYISPKNGGEGCVRDVIEHTLRIQKKWFIPDIPLNKAF